VLLALAVLTVVLPFTLFNGTVPGTGLGDVQSGSVTYGSARLTMTSQRPLTIKGRGFAPLERVRVRNGTAAKRVRASRSGTFTVQFAGVGCPGETITAVGSKGSRATLNVSQLFCLEP
jgi:hypothetical protein